MKRITKISALAVILLAIMAVNISFASGPRDKKVNNQQSVLVLKGRVVDKETLQPLVFASVTVMESNIATVTNIDGEFVIKVPESESAKNLEITYLGYRNKILPLIEMKNDGFKNIITMETAPIPTTQRGPFRSQQYPITMLNTARTTM